MAHPGTVLRGLGLDEYVPVFEEHKVTDITTLDKDFVSRLIPLVGPCALVWNAIKHLREAAGQDPDMGRSSWSSASARNNLRLPGDASSRTPINRGQSIPSMSARRHSGIDGIPEATSVLDAASSIGHLAYEQGTDRGAEASPLVQQGRPRFPTLVDDEGGRAVATVPESLSVHWSELSQLPFPDADRRAAAAREATLREVSDLRRIQHPHLVQILQVVDCAEQGCTHVVYSYPKGSLPFADLVAVRAQSAAASSASRWVSQVCSALAELHRRGIVHGRVTLGTLSVDPSGAVRLLHLGVDNAVLDGQYRHLQLLRRAKLQLARASGHWCSCCDGPAHGMSRTMCSMLNEYLSDPSLAPPGFDETLSQWERRDLSVCVAPEMHCGAGGLTPAADSWSVGVLWYVLQFGCMPAVPDAWFQGGPSVDTVVIPPCDPDLAAALRQLLTPQKASRPTAAALLTNPLLAAEAAAIPPAPEASPADIDVSVSYAEGSLPAADLLSMHRNSSAADLPREPPVRQRGHKIAPAALAWGSASGSAAATSPEPPPP